MEVENSRERAKGVRTISDIGSFLERIEWALYDRDRADPKRIFSMVALGLIRRHPPTDGAGEESRVQRTMTELFGEETVTGRPRKRHDLALLKMADMYVNDRADRALWEDNRRLGIPIIDIPGLRPRSKRAPKLRGAERLAEAAALQIYKRTDETIIRRLRDDFNQNRTQLLEMREEILAVGDVEKELASLILELLADRGMDVDMSVVEAASPFNIEELVY